jgi:hypothetical protein
MPEIDVKIDLSWYHINLLKEIEEKEYDSHKVVKLIKMIAERNIEIICKLFEFQKEHDLVDDIKTFLEKGW